MPEIEEIEINIALVKLSKWIKEHPEISANALLTAFSYLHAEIAHQNGFSFERFIEDVKRVFESYKNMWEKNECQK